MFSRSVIRLGFCLAAITSISVCQGQDSAGIKTIGSIEVADKALLELIDADAKIEVLATGFQWSEGPVWRKADNFLLLSDVPQNKIHQWTPDGKSKVFMDPSGYEGDNKEKEPGSNGLMEDAQGCLVVCDHGNRRVYRLEKDGTKTTLADRYQGKRFNSPNDLVIHSNGDIYFTDPPYGLRDASKRELDFYGIYRLKPDGAVDLLTKEFFRPNGIALSPDEKTLYVAQSHRPAPVIKSFPVLEDGTIESTGGKVLYNCKPHVEAGDKGMPDGMCVDVKGNLWATGPGGVLIISPEGKLLGRIMLGKPTANCAFGLDGKTLFITSSDRLCRVKIKVKGLGF